jgi:hypothetical protein
MDMYVTDSPPAFGPCPSGPMKEWRLTSSRGPANTLHTPPPRAHARICVREFSASKLFPLLAGAATSYLSVAAVGRQPTYGSSSRLRELGGILRCTPTLQYSMFTL